MKSHAILIVVVAALVAASAMQASASLVSLNTPDNVAALATATASSIGNWEVQPIKAIDNNVSDGIPGAASFEDSSHFFFVDQSAPNTLDLNWSTPQHLKSLQTYVCHGGTTFPDADRTVSAVQFYVNQGAGFVSVGTVATADTNDVGCFDLTKIDGNWSNVTGVRYEYTDSSNQGPRVAEVLAISTAVPEPGTCALIISGLLGLLSYAWRKRK
jgi:hypothetical protein